MEMKNLLEYINTKKKYADIIVLCNDEILLLRRANYMKQFPGKWCIPGGTVDNEKTEQTVLRELKEETSIEISKPKFWETYTYQSNSTTDIYYVELQDKPEVKISKEHAQYKWVKTDELVKYSEKMANETYSIIKQFFETYYNSINERG